MDASQGARPLPYTDLALEATAALRGDQGGEIPGVRMEESRQGEVTVSRVEVFSEEGARAIGKAPGHYITLDAPGRRRRGRGPRGAGGPGRGAVSSPVGGGGRGAAPRGRGLPRGGPPAPRHGAGPPHPPAPPGAAAPLPGAAGGRGPGAGGRVCPVAGRA